MAKVTSKLQVTIPKSLAGKCGIRAGDEIDWAAAADGIRITPSIAQRRGLSIDERLALFDAATQRQRKRQRGKKMTGHAGRGWKREDIYTRGRTH